VGGVLAFIVTLIEKGDDLAIVCFVDTRHTAARQQPAPQTPKNPHGACLDPARGILV